MNEIKIVSTDGEAYELTADITTIDGIVYRVQVGKVGGGTIGKAYDGDWAYRVFMLETGAFVAEGADLRTGTPKTHAEAAEILLDFLAD